MHHRLAVLALAASSFACGGALRGDSTGDAGAGTMGGDDASSTPPPTADKLDILFMIDNSESMGDKQQFLAAAIPDFVGRLVTPNCIAADGLTIDGRSSSDGSGTCPAGDHVEFAPVHDMHIGVVTSSLGPRGGDVCSPTQTDGALNAHNDDRGELIDRGGATETPVSDMTSSSFLAWFPSTSANSGKAPGATPTVTNAETLFTDFEDLVTGVHQGGCGVESQLESWYRFLIQPDPYDSIAVINGTAAWVSVDAKIIEQRRDFLRPDSAVVIVDLTDENDSEIDVRTLGQQGFTWMSTIFQPPRGTSACLTNPADPSCTSCAIMGEDPSCASGAYMNQNDWGFNLNLRHVHMKEKYGLDVQFPLLRYVKGLTSATVPDRDGEYPTNSAGTMATSYIGTNDCTNPLFAGVLPDGSALDKASLCTLPPGPRSPGLVFYAHIGGVPWQLLHYVPNDPATSALASSDWTKILGNNPDGFDYAGIDPHMIESYQPRAGLPSPTSDDDADPIQGREWVTDSNPMIASGAVDLEFACTFPLVVPHDCTDPTYMAGCDCPTAAGTIWGKQYTPPVCGGGGSLNAMLPQTTQIAAKAYPTIREIELVQKMGANGVLGSICPVHVTDNSTNDDPFYGYRPAVATLIDRLKPVLTQ